MDGSQKHHAKQKKPDTKDHTLYDSIYIKCPLTGKPIETESSAWDWG